MITTETYKSLYSDRASTYKRTLAHTAAQLRIYMLSILLNCEQQTPDMMNDFYRAYLNTAYEEKEVEKRREKSQQDSQKVNT